MEISPWVLVGVILSALISVMVIYKWYRQDREKTAKIKAELPGLVSVPIPTERSQYSLSSFKNVSSLRAIELQNQMMTPSQPGRPGEPGDSSLVVPVEGQKIGEGEVSPPPYLLGRGEVSFSYQAEEQGRLAGVKESKWQPGEEKMEQITSPLSFPRTMSSSPAEPHMHHFLASPKSTHPSPHAVSEASKRLPPKADIHSVNLDQDREQADGMEKKGKTERIRERKGVIVSSISPDSPAAQAGLQMGDIITHVDGIRLCNEKDMAALMNNNFSSHSLRIRRGMTALEFYIEKSNVTYPQVSSSSSSSSSSAQAAVAQHKVLSPVVSSQPKVVQQQQQQSITPSARGWDGPPPLIHKGSGLDISAYESKEAKAKEEATLQAASPVDNPLYKSAPNVERKDVITHAQSYRSKLSRPESLPPLTRISNRPQTFKTKEKEEKMDSLEEPFAGEGLTASKLRTSRRQGTKKVEEDDDDVDSGSAAMEDEIRQEIEEELNAISTSHNKPDTRDTTDTALVTITQEASALATSGFSWKRGADKENIALNEEQQPEKGDLLHQHKGPSIMNSSQGGVFHSSAADPAMPGLLVKAQIQDPPVLGNHLAHQTVHSCDFCASLNQPADFSCVQCQVHYCRNHLTSHHPVRFRHHTLLPARVAQLLKSSSVFTQRSQHSVPYLSTDGC